MRKGTFPFVLVLIAWLLGFSVGIVFPRSEPQPQLFDSSVEWDAEYVDMMQKNPGLLPMIQVPLTQPRCGRDLALRQDIPLPGKLHYCIPARYEQALADFVAELIASDQ